MAPSIDRHHGSLHRSSPWLDAVDTYTRWGRWVHWAHRAHQQGWVTQASFPLPASDLLPTLTNKSQGEEEVRSRGLGFLGPRGFGQGALGSLRFRRGGEGFLGFGAEGFLGFAVSRFGKVSLLPPCIISRFSPLGFSQFRLGGFHRFPPLGFPSFALGVFTGSRPWDFPVFALGVFALGGFAPIPAPEVSRFCPNVVYHQADHITNRITSPPRPLRVATSNLQFTTTSTKKPWLVQSTKDEFF